MPYLEYVLFILNACTDRLLTRLQRLQNRGLRICLRSDQRTPVIHMHQKARCLTVKDKIRMNTIKQMHRKIYNPCCRYRKIPARTMRNTVAPLFAEIFLNSVKFQKSLCGFGFTIWNTLEADVRGIRDRESFKILLKRKMIQDLNLRE